MNNWLTTWLLATFHFRSTCKYEALSGPLIGGRGTFISPTICGWGGRKGFDPSWVLWCFVLVLILKNKETRNTKKSWLSRLGMPLRQVNKANREPRSLLPVNWGETERNAEMYMSSHDLWWLFNHAAGIPPVVPGVAPAMARAGVGGHFYIQSECIPYLVVYYIGLLPLRILGCKSR